MLHLFFSTKEIISDTIEKIKFNYLPFPMKTGDDEIHLKAVIDWLEEASKNGKGGVSSHYSLLKGKWLHPFPETTGYIIPTLYDYAEHSSETKYKELAKKLCDWLVSVQLPDGGCVQGSYDEKKGKTKAIIFNTGQNILGFLRTYLETNDKKYSDAAVRAGDLLTESIDENGIWIKNLHRGLKHTINTRTCWSLLELNKVVPKEAYIKTAVSNLNWTLDQQTENGWFRHGSSRENGLPNTHFLAYTYEGLIQSYRILKDKKYLEAAEKTAGRMMRIFENRKMLYAFWDDKWTNQGRYLKNGRGKYLCVTGNIQISIVWMWLFEETGDHRYLNAALKMLDYIKTTQNLSSGNPGIRGGIKGSFPVYGAYSTMSFPNWAAKYFADALMLKVKLMKKVEKDFQQELKKEIQS
jgi:rhamnogalacturonyl hydrolase YesR